MLIVIMVMLVVLIIVVVIVVTLFMVVIAISSGSAFGVVMWLAKINDCVEPGRSIRYTADSCLCSTRPMFFSGVEPPFHEPNRFSMRGTISSSVVSPTTTSVALSALNHAS